MVAFVWNRSGVEPRVNRVPVYKLDVIRESFRSIYKLVFTLVFGVLLVRRHTAVQFIFYLPRVYPLISIATGMRHKDRVGFVVQAFRKESFWLLHHFTQVMV